MLNTPTNDDIIQAVKQKTVKGIFSLFLRQGAIYFISIVGNIILARILKPSDFGIYAIIAVFVNFLVVFGDVGLGASLVQSTTEPSGEDYCTIFTFQQILVTALIVVAFMISPLIVRHYHLKAESDWMIRLMVITIGFATIRSISAIKLERHLEFTKLAGVEIAESFLFQVTAISLAILNMGVWSFVIGAIVKSVIGVFMIFAISPWRIRLHWEWPKVRSLMRFGLPYQGITIISLIKDSINPVLIGTLIGATAVGYVNWANVVASYPIFIIFIFNRLFFPAFSRLKHHTLSLEKAVEKVIYWNNLLVFILLAVLVSQVREITLIIFGAKWLPAVPLVYLFSFGDMFIASCAPLFAVLNALGKSRLAFIFSVVWMLSTWVFGYPLIRRYGFIGYGIAHMAVQLTNIAFIWKVKSLIKVRIISAIYPSIIGFCIAVGTTIGLKSVIHAPQPINAILLGTITFITYLCVILVINWRRVWDEISSVVKLRQINA